MSGADNSETIPSRFESISRRFAQQEAVRTPEATLTYEELNRAAKNTARRILELAPRSAEPIALIPGQFASTLVGLLGVLQAGRISTCLDPSWPPTRLTDVLSRLGAQVVLTDRKGLSVVGELTHEALRCLLVEDVPDEPEGEDLPRCAPPDTPACIIFTSGSTGLPNGVIQSHRNLLQYVAEQTRALQLSARDRMPLLFPLSSMAGLMAVLRALLNGATLVARSMEGAAVEDLPGWVESESLTMFHSSPSVFRQLGLTAQGRSQFSSVKRIYLSGEPVTDREVRVFRDFFSKDCVLYNNLGCTEASSFRRLRIPQSHEIQGETVPVGYEIDGKEVFLLDKAGNPVGPGDVGEICVRSHYLSPGYWGKDELTRKRFPVRLAGKEGARTYLTGDVGRMRSDGCLEYLGRQDHQVKIRGHRVETEAVDVAIHSLPYVDDAVVVARRRADGENSLVAFVVLSDAEPTMSRLRRDLATTLPDSMLPARFVTLDSLPRLPGGKVDRASLPTPDRTRPELDTPLVLPRTPLEKQLADVWAKVLDIDRVGVDDPFLDLGGDSLTAVRLVCQIEHVTGRAIAVESIAELSTVRAMAKSLTLGNDGQQNGELIGAGESWPRYRRRMVAAAAGSRVQLVRKGSTIGVFNPQGTRRPLFWCFNNYDLEMPVLAEALGPDQPIYGLFSGSVVTPGGQEFIRYLATQYSREVDVLQSTGPLMIGGNCRGARVAFELAYLLRASGRELEGLCFLEFFDPRLFDELDRITLLYGRESHLKAYEPFRWGEEGWQDAFRRAPVVDWVPGAHGEFFTPANIGHLANKVREFLEAGYDTKTSVAS